MTHFGTGEQTFDPEKAHEVLEIRLSQAGVEAILDKSETREDVAKSLLPLYWTEPRPMSSELLGVYSKPTGNGFSMKLRVRRGHWLISSFILGHKGDVSVRHDGGAVRLHCYACKTEAIIPLDSCVLCPTYWSGARESLNLCKKELP